MDQQTESNASPSLQMNRQFFPVRPEIFERFAVVQLNIREHDFLNCIQHEGLLSGQKKQTCKKGGSALAKDPSPKQTHDTATRTRATLAGGSN
jgi:hypothetical protein